MLASKYPCGVQYDVIRYDVSVYIYNVSTPSAFFWQVFKEKNPNLVSAVSTSVNDAHRDALYLDQYFFKTYRAN